MSNQKKLNEQELKEILELAQKAKQKAKEMCKVIMEHSAKYQSWYREAQIRQSSLPSK